MVTSVFRPVAGPDTPHPLANVRDASDRTLGDLLVLHRSGKIPGWRLRQAGVPCLAVVVAEVLRREQATVLVPAS